MEISEIVLPGISGTLHHELQSPLRAQFGVVAASEAAKVCIHSSQDPALEQLQFKNTGHRGSFHLSPINCFMNSDKDGNSSINQ